MKQKNKAVLPQPLLDYLDALPCHPITIVDGDTWVGDMKVDPAFLIKHVQTYHLLNFRFALEHFREKAGVRHDALMVNFLRG